MKIFQLKPCGKLMGAIPARLSVGVMMFTACMLSYMLRVNMSINILDMVHHDSKYSNNSRESACVRVVPRNVTEHSLQAPTHEAHRDVISDEALENTKFNWSSNTQGVILGAYFWGYTTTSLLGGPLAERWGPRSVVGVSSGAAAILTLLSPLAADLHHWALAACRFLIGAVGGVMYPSLHCLVANWAPPDEKGKFVSALMGGTFGTVITWSICGVLISSLGWQWAFYIPGVIVLAWTVLWFVLVADSPQDHPRISEKEKAYILDCIGESVDVDKPLVPLKDVLTSVPFWAFTVLHYGNLWGLYFLLTAGPKFISQVLGFNLSQAGFISGVPYITRMIMGFVFGSIGDFVRSRGLLSVTAMRKSFCVFSHFLPGLLLVLLSYVGCNPVISVVLLTASLGINGAATVTNLQNHQDLAPNYAGTLYGIANCIGSTTGFITPLVTSYFTKERNGFEEWRYIFFIGAAAYFISGLIFMIFGTGNTQSWNKKTPNNNTSKSIDNLAFEMENNGKQNPVSYRIQPSNPNPHSRSKPFSPQIPLSRPNLFHRLTHNNFRSHYPSPYLLNHSPEHTKTHVI